MLIPMTAAALLTVNGPVTSAPPALSAADSAAGWALYTGSNASTLWRGYKEKGFPSKGWKIENGELSISKGGGGGDLITKEQFADVEMSFQFRLGEKANSGVMWRVAETDGPSYMTGPEYQLLEDATYGAKPTDPHACAALYDLYPPGANKTTKPVGQWNEGRIYIRNGLVQHWLNGKKVVEARAFDAAGKPTKEWSDKIAASKFKDAKGFGVQPKGHLAIQDHGDTELALRDVRIRDLAAPLPGEISLFNGKDLTGWKAVVPDLAAKQQPETQVWEVRDGVLICKGSPAGYIRTEKDYTSYVLRLEWRFNPAKGPGNSGVLLRMVGADKVWPKSVEAQLESGNAGDFWNIDNFVMTAAKDRTNGRNTKKTHEGAERPVGEWNEYEIIVDGGTVVLNVNGEELNRATGVEVVPGKICLQSEGAEIQFRNIRLSPLK
ncbi:MAG: DUF1080 domain-containing protein [Phycisphaerae bacterium]|nr:DUF1080 domain-containing protein [Phycisphaerae bacterium]